LIKICTELEFLVKKVHYKFTKKDLNNFIKKINQDRFEYISMENNQSISKNQQANKQCDKVLKEGRAIMAKIYEAFCNQTDLPFIEVDDFINIIKVSIRNNRRPNKLKDNGKKKYSQANGIIIDILKELGIIPKDQNSEANIIKKKWHTKLSIFCAKLNKAKQEQLEALKHSAKYLYYKNI
jgi:hypothetical protein